jgi:hypothetical protein
VRRPEWLARLESQDPISVLETLDYMGSAVDERSADVFTPEAHEYDRRARALRESPDTQRDLARLAESQDPWIREAAAALVVH